ncbi:hypothetical protein GCM10007276_12260 [Agaricicola taiwanensis]|uniref:Uncharacterized protein n=1 Tax=Agaricicola taiwanensis TaxID=591372 RepID=A0A8J2VNW5_9RHOB|nr:hypothetical protein [Agaricicola taiwanensis]GGE36330.1 hypothetical protein GCM10007276_12260 [Agaricicola taiwanensis]
MTDEDDIQTDVQDANGAPAESEQSDAKPEAEIEEGEGEAKTKTEDEGSEDRADDDADEEDDRPKRRRSGTERLKRQIAELRAELDRRSTSAGGQDSGISVDIGPEPKEEDFKDDFFAYERAKTVYEMRKAAAEDRAKEAQREIHARQQEHYRQLGEEYSDREKEVRQHLKDYDAVVTSFKGEVSNAVKLLIVESDKGPHLTYYLAKHPEKVRELNGMTERAAAREIGRLESRLSLPTPNKQTKAPPPGTSLKGGAAPKSPESDLDAWLKKTYG